MSLNIWEMLLSLSGGNHVFISVPAIGFPSLFFILFLPHQTVSKLQVNIILWKIAVYTCAKYYFLQGTQYLKFLTSYILNFQKIYHMFEFYLSILGSGIALFPPAFRSLNHMPNLHNSIYCFIVWYIHVISLNLLMFFEYFIELFYQPILYIPLFKNISSSHFIPLFLVYYI